MKKPTSMKDLYKGIRKPVPPPTKSERDRRRDLQSRDARKEIEEHTSEKRREGAGEDDT